MPLVFTVGTCILRFMARFPYLALAPFIATVAVAQSPGLELANLREDVRVLKIGRAHV